MERTVRFHCEWCGMVSTESIRMVHLLLEATGGLVCYVCAMTQVEPVRVDDKER